VQPAKAYVLFNLFFGLSIGSIAAGYVPYLLSVGITLPQVALINAIFFLTIILMELPTGMLADGRGRIWSVRIGVFMVVLGKLFYSAATGLFGAILCEILIGISFAFMSGALEAWVADAVNRNKSAKQLRRVFADGAMSLSVGILSGGVSGAVVSSIDLRAGFWQASCCATVALIIACCWMGDVGEPRARTSEFVALRDSLVALKNSVSLRWVLIAFTAFSLVTSFNHYWSPFFREKVSQAGLSFIWLIMFGGSIVGSYLVRHRVKCERHESLALVLSMIIAGFGLTLVGRVEGLFGPLAFAFLHEIGRGAFKPLVDAFVQQRVQSSFRATYGSLQSLVSRLGYAVVLALVWLLTHELPDDQRLIVGTWTVQGCLLVVIAVILWFRRPTD
jgi:MFS family permease